MRIGVLGTGGVGRTLATRLVQLGHEVTMGSRARGNERAVEWAASQGPAAREGSFADAASFGELLINATNGGASVEALRQAGEANLAGKVLVDVSNALDASRGFPPAVGVSTTDSLGEQLQRAFPGAHVVKTLNTVNSDVMVKPAMLAGEHAVFLCGDDAAAKEQVRSLLRDFGWTEAGIVDLGGIAESRGPELYVALWIRLYMKMQTGHFNIGIVRSE